MTNRELGMALRAIRLREGVTQDLVARLSRYTQEHISRYETGQTPVSIQGLRGYALATGRAQEIVQLISRALCREEKSGRVS